jgi:hypothetical protein
MGCADANTHIRPMESSATTRDGRIQPRHIWHYARGAASFIPTPASAGSASSASAETLWLRSGSPTARATAAEHAELVATTATEHRVRSSCATGRVSSAGSATTALSSSSSSSALYHTWQAKFPFFTRRTAQLRLRYGTALHGYKSERAAAGLHTATFYWTWCTSIRSSSPSSSNMAAVTACAPPERRKQLHAT